MASPIQLEERPDPTSTDFLYGYQKPPYSPCKGVSDGESCKAQFGPIQLVPSGSLNLNNLICNESESTLEPIQDPVHRDPPVGAMVAPVATYDVADVREVIRADLSRLQELCYVPELPGARRFAEENRPRVVSWLVEVVSALQVSKETLHSAVSLLDRFIAGTEVHPPEAVLQLLALGCLSAAAKHEEVVQRSSDEWVRLAVGNDQRNLYERVDLHRMEWLLLETVEWRIRVPNAFTFLRQYHTVLVHHRLLPEDLVYATLFKGCAEFMAEISMLYAEFLPFGYSTVAVASLTMAEWFCQSVFASGQPGSPQAQPGANSFLVSELAAFIGVDEECLAPDLGSCIGFMSHLYQLVNNWGPWGSPPTAEELGLLGPVVARYRQLHAHGAL